MLRTLTLHLLQASVVFGAAATQIYFPGDSEINRNYGTRLFTSKVESEISNQNVAARRLSSSYEQSVDAIVPRSISQLVLNINRIVPTTSSHLANADNLVYGPATITGVLSLILMASVGRTFDEIYNLMGLSSEYRAQNDPLNIHRHLGRLSQKIKATSGLEVGTLINFATAIFVQQDYPIRQAYQQACKVIYHGDILNLDFRGNSRMAKNVINSWVAARTNSKISELLDDAPSPDTKAVMVSILYFKAAWEFPFFDGNTKWRPFYVNGRKSASDRMVEMMSNGGEFPYFKDNKLGVEIMGFPYKGGRTSMFVLLPIESSAEKLKQLEKILTPNDIVRLVNSTKPMEAVILFPKMKLETNVDLKSTLQTLGVSSLFNPHQSNLPLLSPGLVQRYKGEEAPFVSSPLTTSRSPPLPQQNSEDRLIFARFGNQANCVQTFDVVTNTTRCQDDLGVALSATGPLTKLRDIRQQLSIERNNVNPGLYVDQVIHKVHIDITESGTEAAAVTSISLDRSGGKIAFRCDTPFLFFIYHEDTGVILFWGSIKSPTPFVVTPKT